MELERQYESMRTACEALRLIGEDGLSVAPDAPVPRAVAASKELTTTGLRMAAEGQREVGRLYRIAMEKKGIWNGVPICLLYTSPSPRDRTRSRMPSSA